MSLLLDTLGDDELGHVLRHVIDVRTSTSLALASKRWLELSKREWCRRAATCVAPEGIAWKPSLALEVESYERGTLTDNVEAHMKRVEALPFVVGLGAAPTAAMWARTKPTQRGAEQVYLDDSGEPIEGIWGCNESVQDYNCDSNWNRSFVWGVMAFSPDKTAEVGFYEVNERSDDPLDDHAVVSQYPLSIDTVAPTSRDMTFLGDQVAIFTSSGLGLFELLKTSFSSEYCIGGRLLRMSHGNSEESVMASLGFVRNPHVADDDYANEARWCRLPTTKSVLAVSKIKQYHAYLIPINMREGSSSVDDSDSKDDSDSEDTN